MDIESKRIEMLQKAGLLENKELAEEMMEIEGASSEYLDHFYEQDRVKGILDPIYQKAL